MDQSERIKKLMLDFSNEQEQPEDSHSSINLPYDSQAQNQFSGHLSHEFQDDERENNMVDANEWGQQFEYSTNKLREYHSIKKEQNRQNPIFSHKSKRSSYQQGRKKNQSKKLNGKYQLTHEEILNIQRFTKTTTDYFIDSTALNLQKVYTFDDLKVYFPYEAYDVQLTYMKSVIQSLKTNKNALLQSPTGTGKTLCLLASVMSWLYSQKKLGRHFKVLYLSRTHSQLAQIQKQLKATCFRPTMSLVGSRQHFCIKPQLDKLKGRQKMEACSKGVHLKIRNDMGQINWQQLPPQQNKKMHETMCNFYSDRSRTVQIGTMNYHNKILEKQSFKQQAKQKHFCPYYYPMHMEQYCDFFIMPYNYILDADLLPRYANMINNSIIIFDQAHNVSDASCQGRSYQMFSANIKGAEAEIGKIIFNPNVSLEIKQIRKLNQKLLQNILNFITDIQAKVNDYLFRIPFEDAPIEKDKLYYNYQQKTRTKVIDSKCIHLAIYELMEGAIGQNQKLKFQENDVEHTRMIEKLGRQIMYIGQQIDQLIQCLKETPDGIFHNIQKVITFCRKAITLLVGSLNQNSFINNQINHYRLLIKVNLDEYSKIKDFTFQLRCLIPWLTFSNIEKYGPRSIIFTSGTMSPLDLWENQLKILAPIKLVNKHVITRKQVRLNIITKSCNGVNFNFGYQNVKGDPDAVYKQLVQSLFQICSKIPNGVLVICPNFKTLSSIRFAIQKNNLQNKFEQIKRIVYQERSNDSYIDYFKEQSKNGAILFCVCRGKASEGIDFPDHTCRAVIFVGVPYPNISDPIIKQRKEHFKDLHRQNHKSDVSYITFEQWYFNSTIRAINQGLGRVIRHKNDYGMLFLLDERYTQPKFDRGLPTWATQTGVDTWKQFNQQKLSQIKIFYQQNSNKFDKDRSYQPQNKGRSAQLKTKEKIKVQINSLETKKKSLFSFLRRTE